MKTHYQYLSGVMLVVGVTLSGCSQQQSATAVPVVDLTPESAPMVDFTPPPPMAEVPVAVAAPEVPASNHREQSVKQTVRPPVVVQQPKVVKPQVNIQPVPAPMVVTPQPSKPIFVPSVKAKGTYRGAIAIDQNIVQQY